MVTTLDAAAIEPLLSRLAAEDAPTPAAVSTRQPIHVVYGGAHLFRADVAQKLGATATRALRAHAPDAATFARALGLAPALAEPVYARVTAKLAREPVEDYRVDFEDGFGVRPDAEEDETAERAARELARGAREGLLPPFVGVRVKSLGPETRARAVRTLDLFVTTLARELGGALPPGFVITLPKVASEREVEIAAALCAALERGLGLSEGALHLELMVELAQALFDREGRVLLPRLVRAAGGRCRGAHFGTYDYTASLDVTAAHQSMRHPACDFARHVMQVSLAGSGVMLSDGATTTMPIGPHRAAPDGALSAAQRAENDARVHAAWRLHHDNVRDSLVRGLYQGWDLHPAQLPVRYAATYAFFLEAEAAAAERLKSFVARAAQASRVGEAFDDAATGQGLLNFFLRAEGCGALDEAAIVARTGLSLAELRLRSFGAIVAARAGA